MAGMVPFSDIESRAELARLMRLDPLLRLDDVEREIGNVMTDIALGRLANKRATLCANIQDAADDLLEAIAALRGVQP